MKIINGKDFRNKTVKFVGHISKCQNYLVYQFLKKLEALRTCTIVNSMIAIRFSKTYTSCAINCAHISKRSLTHATKAVTVDLVKSKTEISIARIASVEISIEIITWIII